MESRHDPKHFASLREATKMRYLTSVEQVFRNSSIFLFVYIATNVMNHHMTSQILSEVWGRSPTNVNSSYHVASA